MERKIKDTILKIIQAQYAKNEPFPCAHSIEVAHELKMNAREVEVIAKNIEGIKTHLTINGAYYEA